MKAAVNGGPPITGPEAIKEFWESRINMGSKNHTYEIVNTWGDGKFAYQFAKASVEFTPATGAKTVGHGFTVRIFEKQPDGTWKAKLHMFNRRAALKRSGEPRAERHSARRLEPEIGDVLRTSCDAPSSNGLKCRFLAPNRSRAASATWSLSGEKRTSDQTPATSLFDPSWTS